MKKTLVILAVAGFLLAITHSCKKEDSKELKVSRYGEQESHNAGQNCMNCHTPEGEGEGLFTVAGSVYDASLFSLNPGSTVRLYTGPNGTGDLAAVIEVDGLGNFYTTANVSFGTGGLYPSVTGATGNSHYMGSAITTGQCYSCHGVTQARIWTD